MSLYSFHHDKTKWNDSEVFRPERFIDEDGQFKPSEEMYFFGAGTL
jgi:cytochrome P450